MCPFFLFFNHTLSPSHLIDIYFLHTFFDSTLRSQRRSIQNTKIQWWLLTKDTAVLNGIKKEAKEQKKSAVSSSRTKSLWLILNWCCTHKLKMCSKQPRHISLIHAVNLLIRNNWNPHFLNWVLTFQSCSFTRAFFHHQKPPCSNILFSLTPHVYGRPTRYFRFFLPADTFKYN